MSPCFYFVLVINDLPDGILSQPGIYVDDATIFSCLESKFDRVKLSSDLKNDAQSLLDGVQKLDVNFKVSPTKLLSRNKVGELFLHSISKANATRQWLIAPSRANVSVDIKWKVYF